MTPSAYIPYCGLAPVPGELGWNLDPWLIAVLVGLVTLQHRLSRSMDTQYRQLATAGWVIALLAFISPLCQLSVALFSARVSQHMILMLVAAPLIACALPRFHCSRNTGIATLLSATTGFSVLLWLWHLPLPYNLTLASHYIYWAMHITLFGSSLLLWRLLLDASQGLAGRFIAGSIAGFQMSLLGAVLAFSPRTLFDVHLHTTAAWGLSPLQDQQLGGMIMWVPAGLFLGLITVAALGIQLYRLDRQYSL